MLKKKPTPKKEAPKKEAPKEEAPKEAATQKTSGEYVPGEGATKHGEKGVPTFYPPQTFPPPPPKPAPISVPPPPKNYTAGIVSDVSSSSSTYDDCPELHWEDEITILSDWARGYIWGTVAAKEGFRSRMDEWLDAMSHSSFAFQYAFLEGVMANDCDPDMYAELYQKLLKRAREAEEKLKKEQEKKKRDMFDPCMSPGRGFGGGGGGGSGGGPPC
jgi:hypothetical protein